MHKPDIAVIDETIDYNRSDDYSLFVQAGSDHLCYALLDKDRNTFVSFHHFPFYHIHPKEKIYERMQEIVTSGPVISEIDFSEKFISVVTNSSTIVPIAIMQDGMEKKFLELNHELQRKNNIYTDTIKIIDAVNIYEVHTGIENIFNSESGKISYMHFATSLIESIILKNKHQEDKHVTLHIQASHFEIIVTKGRSLIFYNSFSYKAPEDILYFLLNVCEQLQINPETIQLQLIGEIEKRSGIYNLLEKYIRFVNFGTRPDSIHFSYGFQDIPPHYYYSLFSLATCV